METYEQQLEKQNEELREKLERIYGIACVLAKGVRNGRTLSTTDQELERIYGTSFNRLCDELGTCELKVRQMTLKGDSIPEYRKRKTLYNEQNGCYELEIVTIDNKSYYRKIEKNEQ